MPGPEHDHDWRLVEVGASARGADRLHECRCGATSYQPGQAALSDDRPPLG